MKKSTKLSLFIALLLNASLIVRAQNAPTQLSDVAKALDCLEQNDSSLWKREQIEPFGGGKDILIYKYVSGGRAAIVKFMYYPSDSEASKSFKSFGEHASARNFKTIQNLGDEAFSWGDDEGIVMRKTNLVLYVNAGSDVAGLLREIEKVETSALWHTEVALLNKNFARMMDKFLSNLNEACRPPQRGFRY